MTDEDGGVGVVVDVWADGWASVSIPVPERISGGHQLLLLRTTPPTFSIFMILTSLVIEYASSRRHNVLRPSLLYLYCVLLFGSAIHALLGSPVSGINLR